jgi:hypothetical protein
MVPLYPFYIKAEEVYACPAGARSFLCRIEWLTWPCQSPGTGTVPIPPPRTFSTLSRQQHHGAIGIVARTSAGAKGSLDGSMSLSSSGTADKPGSHKLFERQQQLILTNCLNHPFVLLVKMFDEWLDCNNPIWGRD